MIPVAMRIFILQAVILLALCSFAYAQNDTPGIDPLQDRWKLNPLRFDDELFVAANLADGGMALGISYPQPRSFDGDAPATLYRRFNDRRVIAGDAGRIMGVPFQQVALVTEDADGIWLDVFSGLFPGQVHIGRHPLPAECSNETDVDCRLSGDIDVLVDELDGFACPESDLRHEEVVVAYPIRLSDTDSGTREAVGFQILAWDGVQRSAGLAAEPSPPSRINAGSAPSEGAVKSRSFRLVTAQLFESNQINTGDGGGSDNTSEPPFYDLIVAYHAETTQDVRAGGFRLLRDEDASCTSPTNGILAMVDFDTEDGEIEGGAPRLELELSDALPLNSPDSWDVIAGRGDQFGILAGSSGSVIKVTNRSVVVSIWAQDSDNSDRIKLRTILHNPFADNGASPSSSRSITLATHDGSPLALLPNTPMRLSLGRIERTDGDEACAIQGVYAFADTELGPVVQAFYMGGSFSSNGELASGADAPPVWPASDILDARPMTSQLSNTTFSAGGFMRDRTRPQLDGVGVECNLGGDDITADLWQGDAESFYLVSTLPENGTENPPQLEVVNLMPALPDASGLEIDGDSAASERRTLPVLSLPDNRSTVAADFVTVNMDIDGNGVTEPTTDGQMIVRFLVGMRGADITRDGELVTTDCTRCSDQKIEDYLTANRAAYDADGDGNADALSDGLQRLRFMLGVTGPALTQGVIAPGCVRCGAAELLDYFQGPLDRPVLDIPVMFAFDADGNTPHFSSGSGDSEVFFSEGSDYRLNSVEAFDVILAEPPKHVDWLPALGGITNISATADLFAEFETQQATNQSVSKETVSDWTLSESESVTRTASAGVDLFGAVKASVEGSIANTTESIGNDSTGNFDSESTSLSITQVSTAERDDQVVSRIMDLHIWRYPAMGLRNDDGSPSNPRFFEIHQPTPSLTFFSGGRTNDAYQPWHQNNNLLTYPVFSGQSFTPAEDEIGEFAIDGNGNDPNDPEARPIWSESAFTVGGLSFSQTLEFTEASMTEQTLASSDTVTESRDTSVKASLEIGGTFKGIGVSASASEERNWSASESFSYADTNITNNEVSDRTRIQLSIPGDIPGERGYRFHPAWFFTPNGGLKLTHAVALEGMGVVPETFWQTHYSAPDPALNMPFRITLDGLGSNNFVLNTDPSRRAIKGMFLRDGRGIDAAAPGERIGTDLSFAPRAGEPVQIEVRVYNLSLATAVKNLKVRFEAQRFDLGQEIGPRVNIGETVIDHLPFRGQVEPDPMDNLSELAHVKPVYMLWDTLNFGPDSPDALATWRIYVTLDPDDEIEDEVHELVDRFGDPLRGVLGEPIDPVPGELGVYLEKGQNNTGWGLIRIAAHEDADDIRGGSTDTNQLVADLAAVKTDLTTGRSQTLMQVRAGDEVNLRLTLGTDRVSRDTFRILLYEGDPQHEKLLAYRRITGLDPAGIDEHIRWQPEGGGTQDFYLVLIGHDDAGKPIKVNMGSIGSIDIEEARP